jgi:3-oxoacid CoA-transferase B subunit
MAQRVAREIPDGSYVNVGIGLPTLVLDQLPPGKQVFFQTENGLLGMGPPATGDQVDPDLVDAGKRPITLVEGAAFFSQSESFEMMRGGHIDLTIIGAFQVSQTGDLANCLVPGFPPSIGGAMDIAVGARRTIVITQHTTKEGTPKILRQCTYPLTAVGVVDLVVTNLGVFEITPRGVLLKERHPRVSVEQIRALTEAELIVD